MNNIIDFLVGTYCCWKFKQIAKRGLEENSIECIQTWANDILYIIV